MHRPSFSRLRPARLRLRRGFTAFELLLTIGILAITSFAVMPMYRNYLIMNDLNTTADQVSEALRRAKLLSQLGEDDASWGYHVAGGTLYRGTSYSGRDTSADELYPFPPTIALSGLPEVWFSKLKGEPSATGEIILTALNGQQRIIYVMGGAEGIVYAPSGELTVCHIPQNNPDNAHTLEIPEAAWPAHLQHGDSMGACEGDDDDSDD